MWHRSASHVDREGRVVVVGRKEEEEEEEGRGEGVIMMVGCLKREEIWAYMNTSLSLLTHCYSLQDISSSSPSSPPIPLIPSSTLSIHSFTQRPLHI